MAKRKTHEEFVEEMKLKNPNVRPLDRYINSRAKILFQCIKCDYKWSAKPDSVLSGHGCPICNSKKKSHDDFKNELFEKHPEIKMLSKYKGNKEKIKIQHLDCGHIEYKLPTSLVCSYRGCYICYKRARIPQNEFENRVYKNNPHIKMLEKYTNSTTNILCECTKDGYKWYATPFYLSHNKNVCPKCSNIVKLTKEIVNKRLIGRKIYMLEECNGIHKKYNFKCGKCNYIWYAELNSILNNNCGCPKCNKSHGETNIEKYLIKENIKFYSQYTFNSLTGVGGRQLSYDFYLPDYNLLIEYQGEQHYRPIDRFGGIQQFEIQEEHDRRKKDYAIENKINLLEISYLNFNNIEQILNKELNINSNEESA